jgi:hypothetical protein
MTVKATKDCAADLMAKLLAEYNKLRADVADLVTKYNAHTHEENTAGAYTQNASTQAVVAGSQGAVTADTISAS